MANKTQEILGYIGAIQTLCEKFPMNFKINYTEYSTSFDFMIDILKLLGVTNRELVQWAANIFADDKEGGFLYVLEQMVKYTLMLNLSKLFSCELNPIIPDELIEAKKNNIGPTQSGFDIDVSLIDIMGYLRNSPLSIEGKHFYYDTNYTVNQLYQSSDFNTFLWYVINRGIATDGNKLMWDNRYNCSETDTPFPIVNVTYRDGETTSTNKLNIKLSRDTYYEKRNILGTKYNKTIFEFNWDFLQSIKMFDANVMLASLIDAFTGSLNLSVGYSLNEQMIMAQVDKIIKNIEKADDTEIEDCYFTFSNDEFNDMLEASEMKMMGQKMMNGEFQQPFIYNPQKIADSLDTISASATEQEKITAIENLFFDIAATPAVEGGIECTDALTWGYDTGLLSALIRAIIYPLVRVIFSPKVILLLQVNAKVMGTELPSFKDFFYALFSVIKNLIRQIKDVLLKKIFEWVSVKFKELLSLFASQLFLEMMSEYRALLETMMNYITWFKTSKVLTTIDDVNYADIIPIKDSPNKITC